MDGNQVVDALRRCGVTHVVYIPDSETGTWDPALATAVRTRDGYPVLSRFFESSVEGLYFLGAVAAASAGPGMRFVSHTGPVAAAVRRSIVGSQDPTR